MPRRCGEQLAVSAAVLAAYPGGSHRCARKQRRRVGATAEARLEWALTIRILARDRRAADRHRGADGDSPQYIVDAALAACLDALGIPR